MDDKLIGRRHSLPYVVSFLNQKGGAGKTTLATNIATKLLQVEHVLLVDSDKQGSARDWHASGTSELAVIGLDRPTIAKDLKKISNGFDWVIIDGVPQLDDMAKETIKCSDLVIIPVQPSPYDIWATVDLIKIIKRLQVTEDKPKAYFCINRKIPNTTLGREVFTALEDMDLPVMISSTTQRIAYINGVSRGETVFDTKDLQAKNEITNIANEIKKILI